MKATAVGNDTFKIVKKVAYEYFQPGFKITTNTHIKNDLGADSLEKLDFLIKIEDEFKRTTPDKQLRKTSKVIETIQNVVDFIEPNLPK